MGANNKGNSGSCMLPIDGINVLMVYCLRLMVARITQSLNIPIALNANQTVNNPNYLVSFFAVFMK